MTHGDQMGGKGSGAQGGPENIRTHETDNTDPQKPVVLPNPLNLSDELEKARRLKRASDAQESVEVVPMSTASKTNSVSAAQGQITDNAIGVAPNPATKNETTLPSVTRVVSANERPVEGRPKENPSQSIEVVPPTSKSTSQELGIAKGNVTSPGDAQIRVIQPVGTQVGATDQTLVKPVPVETKTGEGPRQHTDVTGGNRIGGVQNLEQTTPQPKSIANPAEHPQPAVDGSSARKLETPGGGQYLVPQKSESLPPAVVQSTRTTLESPSGVVSNPVGSKDAKTLVDLVATNQFKGELPVAQQTKNEPVKFEPPKGSDVISTQGAAIAGNRQDVLRSGDSKVETGRPAEPAGAKDAVPVRDPRSAGVMNEILGQKSETGPRAESASLQSTGNKQDTAVAGQKADQITKGIEGRVNEGAKQPSVAEGRVLGTSETTTAAGKQPGAIDGATSSVRQPGIESGGKTQGITDGAQPGVKQTGATDGAGVTGKQPNVSDGANSSVRQPLHEGGDKAPSIGGSGSNAADSTKKFDAGLGGGKAEGQTATGGMGGGSSSPTDRAPHKPFSVEDVQPTKGAAGDVRSGVTGARGGDAAGGKVGDVVGGKGGDITGTKGGDIAGEKGGEAAGGKAGDVVGGKAGDIAGTKGPTAGSAGPRFDTGEVRGTEPGARFDAGELKDGRSAGTQSGGLKGGDGSAVKGSDAGIVKGADITGTKGAAGSGQGIGGSSGGSGSGSSGSSESGILGDKRQPSMLPDGMLNQGGKPGKVGDGISGGGGILGTDVPFVLPGALSGKEGGRRQADQIFTDKGKADVAPVGKQDAVAAAGKFDSSGQGGKSDSSGPAGRGEPVGPGGRGEPGGPGGLSGKGEQQKDFKDKGQKADVGIPAAMAGQIGAGAAEVGGALKNFAQSVLSDGKSAGQAGEGAQISKDLKDAFKAPAAMDGSGKETPNVRQDYSGPGRKTQILPNEITPGTTGVGPGGVPVDAAAKKSELGAPGSALPGAGSEGIAAGGFADDAEGGVPLEEFNLPEVDLLSDADEVEEVEEIEEAVEAKIEDEMHYELALGLQLYTSIAGAQYGAYHYHTKDGDTVESVSRDIVGDVRCSPLVFSLNKEHIVASTEYGVHPFKVGVMVQLPTPRDLKEFFGEQA